MSLNNGLHHNLNTPELDLPDDSNFDLDDVLQKGRLESNNILRTIDMDTEVKTSTEQGITDNDGYPIMSVTSTTTDNQVSLNVTTNISATTYILRRKKVPGDGSCLYWSFIDAMSLSPDAQDLRNKVANYILKMDIDDIQLQFPRGCQDRGQYCDRIRNGAWGGEPELEALSQMYRIMIRVINLRRDQQQNLPINTINYGENDELCTKCIFVIYDRAVPHYEPLYLFNTETLQDEIKTFNRDDTRVDDLLPDFITFQIDSNNIIPTTQNAISYQTHEFRTGELPGNGQSLYDATTFLSDRSKMTNVECLREKVADVIRNHTDNDGIHVPPSLDYQNREDYCRMVEEGIISGSEPECYGLSYLYPDTLFCIIPKPNKNNNALLFNIYVKDFSSHKKCIILYNEANNIYKPLYLYDKINDEEEKTNFKYDYTVYDLLLKFIQNELDYCEHVNLDSEKNSHATDSPSHVEHESIDLAEMITENHSKNKSEKHNMKKRKAPEDDDNFIINKEMKKLTMNTNNEKTQLLTSSRPVPSTNQISRFRRENDISGNIDTLLQTATMTNIMEEQEIEDLSPTLSPNTSVAHDEQMRFETDPIKVFRGRALSDYVPKSEKKRDGTKAKPRPPSYFPDCNNKHYLNLLIPTRDLFHDLSRAWLEIALVTRTIKGCIYFNPLFDFLPYKDGSYGDPCNPMYIKLEDVETHPLTKCTDEIQKLVLKLVVIMRTNAELRKKASMIPFLSLSSNGQAQAVQYIAHDKVKNDFQLNNFCFAITLCTDGPDDEKHQLHLNTQYISQVSTQDKNVKLYE
ncbi:unnamed protein product [Adineta steineri]|uniref:Ubiquitin thioesterase OTU n=1 Tax=Adineta steineri TaxID=433720 RepID=A0A815BU53_9BILA|nr:unnamed protein product [Adineta steineri]